MPLINFSMTVFDKIREKNKAIAFIVKLQNTALYPLLFAVVCIISGTHGKAVYLPCAWLLTAIVVFTVLFADDIKVAMVPFLMVYYVMGFDCSFGFLTGSILPPPTFDSSSLWHFIPCIVIMFSSIIVKICLNGLFKDMLTKRGKFFWGIVIFSLAMPIGGIFSNEFSWYSVGFGAIFGATLVVTYLIFSLIVRTSEDSISYICKTMCALGYAVTGQIVIIALYMQRLGVLFTPDGKLNYTDIHTKLSLSWGLSTIIGAILVVAIIATIYLVHDQKYPMLYLFSIAIFFCAIVFIVARTAMLVTVIAIIIGMISCSFSGKNKKTNLVAVISFVVTFILGTILFVILFPDSYDKIINKLATDLRFDFIFEGFEDKSDLQDFFNDALTGRPRIWDRAVEDFLDAPVFGKGFRYGFYFPDPAKNKLFDLPFLNAKANPFTKMYHNLPLQILASMGIVGFISFIPHAVDIVKALFRKFSSQKMILLMLPIAIMAMSLADNFFFQPNFMLFYTAFLACAEFVEHGKRQAE